MSRTLHASARNDVGFGGEAASLKLEMAPEVDQLLQDLAHRVHGDEADAIRWGLALLKVALDAWDREDRLAIIDKDDTIKARIYGL